MSVWSLEYDEWKPDQQPLREALCTLGNGYFASRGAAEEARAGGRHYPGSYLAGGYNRLVSEVAGRRIENEDLVNWPNWLYISFRHEDGEWFDIDRVDVSKFWQNLDLKRGVLERRVTFTDQDGRTSTVHARRLVNMRRMHLAAIEWSLTPEDWSGPIVIRSEIDGNVSNAGVERYSQLRGDHLRITHTSKDDDGDVWLVSQAKQSMLRVAQAARHRLYAEQDEAEVEVEPFTEPHRASHQHRLAAREGQRIRLEKIVSVFTQRDWAISEPALEACKLVKRAGDFEQLVHEHELEWERLWEQCDITIGDSQAYIQKLLRLHIFHLLQTVSMNSIDTDAGVPARGWHGEAYRGHIFWDELFIFPFLTLRIPELTRNLLMYRYRRLDEARQAAVEEGFSGAMYPWQSGSNGREESQKIHLNPRSGNWIPDTTHRQRHINAAIAYNIWSYYQATGDEEFLSFYGAEMLIEIARFWASIARFNEDRGRYDIAGVVGPDEYHTDSDVCDQPGLLNNAYTNVMASWCLRTAMRVFDTLPETRCGRLHRDLGITEEEIERWNDVSRKLHIPFHDGDIISQFEGYESLAEFDWEKYRNKYEDIQRLDRILEAENDTPNRYKASKQADVLMLFYLFSAEQLEDLFNHLGYDFDPKIIPKNIEYYEDRTSHGSTLSRVVHAWVLARSRREQSWSFFQGAIRSDIEDIQGGTTSEGIHLGAMSGTVDLIQRCYTGIEVRDDVLWLNPALPPELESVSLSLRFRGHSLSLKVTPDEIKISSCRDGPVPVKIGLLGEISELRQGQSLSTATA